MLDLDIQVYVGPTRIIDVSNLESIGKKELEKFHLEGVERLLLRTSSHGKANEFPDIIRICVRI